MRTVTLSLDRQTVELDLSEANHAKLPDVLSPYLDAGRKTSTSRSRKSGKTAASKQTNNQAVREWAKANGHEVSSRGRIKQNVLGAYEAAPA